MHMKTRPYAWDKASDKDIRTRHQTSIRKSSGSSGYQDKASDKHKDKDAGLG
jgi:hypothetical protein